MILATAIAAVFYTRKRYAGTKRLFGLYSAQFFNLFVAMPIITISIVNITLEVNSRPEVQNIPTSANLILSLLILSLISTAIGNGIHSTSTSVSEAFPEETRTKAYFTNEIFHKYLSHEFINIGAIGIAIFLGLLEINHPAQYPPFSPGIAVSLGIIIGFIASFSIIRGTYIGLSLLILFWGMLVMAFSIYPLYSSHHLYNYPLSLMNLTSIATTFLLLLAFSIIVIFTDNLEKRVVKLIFPKRDELRKSFHI